MLASALKHCTTADVMHALHHPIRVMPDIRADVDLYIGPSTSGNLLEVLVDENDDEPVVFHADVLRPAFSKFLKGW